MRLQQYQQHELAKRIVVYNEANAWNPEKTNGCSSAAAAATAAMSGENADGGFSFSANPSCAEPS